MNRFLHFKHFTSHRSLNAFIHPIYIKTLIKKPQSAKVFLR